MIIYFWFLYLLLFPFQIFSPGSLQISDYVIIIGILINIKKIFRIGYNEEYSKMLLYFCLYSFFIATIFSLLNSNLIFFKNPFNYIYCLFFLYFIITTSQEVSFYKLTFLGITLSTIIQFFLFLKIGVNTNEIRSSLFFNNPNQLGFWALNMFVILILLKTQTNYKFSKFIYIPFILSIILIIISISQAAIISIILFLLYFIFLLFKKNIVYVSLFLIVVSFSSLKYFSNFEKISIIGNVIERINSDQENDDLDDNGLEGRNYTRLTNFPKYLIFGSGEGLAQRFGNKDMNEIHSTFANLIFTYGIVGLLLFTMPYFYIILNKNLFNIITLGIYLVFTLVHSTLRWPLFWIIPYLIYFIDKKRTHVWN